ncbi:MAG: DUF1028 domain-containing protein [Acidimicrobiia bacterium]|nr:DUF1028 domain-containing protein [Acidimicrobiia bacterium]
MTYSILALDSDTGQVGGAVQSHFFAVGRRCLTLRPGVGAVGSQAFGSAAHGPRALDAVASHGSLPEGIIDRLLADDPNRDQRQVLVLDAAGSTAAYTGPGCLPNARHVAESGVVAGGNTLLSDELPARMVAAFGTADGPLAVRLLAAMDAAEEAGGDTRGAMSAALRVVGPDPVEFIQDGTLVDLRVDHADDPVGELRRLLGVSDGHGQLVRGVLSPGRLVGVGRDPVEFVDVEELDRSLLRAQEAMGQEDLEVTFWRGVVALRTGRTGLARDLLARAIAVRPAFHDLLVGVDAVGRADVSAELLRSLDPTQPL